MRPTWPSMSSFTRSKSMVGSCIRGQVSASTHADKHRPLIGETAKTGECRRHSRLRLWKDSVLEAELFQAFQCLVGTIGVDEQPHRHRRGCSKHSRRVLV